MKNNKNTKAILLGVILMVLAVAGATYAYFTATITDGDKGSSVIIKTGTLQLVYSDTEYINVSGVLPGDSYSKVVTITNEGNVTVSYDLIWMNLINELITKNDLTMEITCLSNTDTCGGLSSTVVSDSGSNIPILNNVQIGMLETHTYTITLHFNETGSNQNDNQGKVISGKIGIVESGYLDLYGYVYDENGDPLSSTIVEFHSDPISVLTNENGYYEISNVPYGNHTLYVKNQDATSTIMTQNVSLTYGAITKTTDNTIQVKDTISRVGVNISKTVSTPTVTLISRLKAKPTASYTGSYYAYQSQITSIHFDTTINVPSNVTASWDVSEDQTSTVMAYVITDGVSGYELHFQANGKIYAPKSCLALFGGTFSGSKFSNLTSFVGFENFDTSEVTYMGSMFNYASKLTSLDLSHFNTSKVTNMTSMLSELTALTSINLSSFDTSKVTSMQMMFTNDTNLTTLDLSSFNTSSVINMSNMFSGMSKVTNLNISSFNTANATDLSGLFAGTAKITSMNVNHFDLSKTTTIAGMFRDMTLLTTLYIDDLNTSNVTGMSNLFSGCSSLTSLDLSTFNTSNVSSFSGMFNGMSNLTNLNISNFNTGNVTNMSNMFTGVAKITSLNLSHFVTTKVTSMSGMFKDMTLLTSLNVSSFDTANVTGSGFYEMFKNVSSLATLNLSNFNTGKATSMGSVFSGMTSLTTLDIRNAAFTTVSSYSSMFANITSGITITVKDSTAQTFINARLSNAGKTGTVTIA